jgi:mono/diheme cytochrome c family protein
MNYLTLAGVGLCLVFSNLGAVAAVSDDASIVRGGRLYDDWAREVKSRPPSGSHPGFVQKDSAVSPADTWRCKQCHGFDYKGVRGLVGIRGFQGKEASAIISVLKNATHRYEGVLEEADLADLANFVSLGQIDMQAAMDQGRVSKNGATSVEKIFGTVCAGCHGLDGSKLRVILPLGDIARRGPDQALHVILNGHPGGEMPALRALGTDTAVKTLSFLQTLPTNNLAASIVHGGRLYDDWQIEAGARRQSLPNPAYPKTAYYADDAQMTWRCKACHGWDYQGNQGEYAAGRNFTGIKGIRGMAGADTVRVLAVLRNSTHNYANILKERDLQDLANFVSYGQVDMDSVIDRQSRRARGDSNRGRAAFQTICASCHGIDGKRITIPLARIVKASPWGSLHTILNGHPDEKMPGIREFDAQMISDILSHVQGLPESR